MPCRLSTSIPRHLWIKLCERQIVALVHHHPNLTVDVGDVPFLFGRCLLTRRARVGCRYPGVLGATGPTDVADLVAAAVVEADREDRPLGRGPGSKQQ